VSTLVASVREAAGLPSSLQIVADSGMALDISLVTCAGHQLSGQRLFRKQRTVNPPIVPARYNFLYASSRPALRAAAAGGRPRPATGRRDRGTGPHRSRTVRSWLSVALPSALAQHLGELRSGGSWPVALTLVERA
jgi:hypothetical protein